MPNVKKVHTVSYMLVTAPIEDADTIGEMSRRMFALHTATFTTAREADRYVVSMNSEGHMLQTRSQISLTTLGRELGRVRRLVRRARRGTSSKEQEE